MSYYYRKRPRGRQQFSSFFTGNTRFRTFAYRRKSYHSNRPQMRLLDHGYHTEAVLPLADSWHSANLFVTSQGTAQTQRIGNTIRAYMAKLTFVVKLTAPAEPNPHGWDSHYRILIIQWYDNQESGPLVHTDVFDATVPATSVQGDLTPILASYRPKHTAPATAQRDRKFRVLYDKSQNLFQYGGLAKVEEIFTVIIKPETVIRAIDGSGALASMENPINMYIFATNSGITDDNPSISVSYRRQEWFTSLG